MPATPKKHAKGSTSKRGTYTFSAEDLRVRAVIPITKDADKFLKSIQTLLVDKGGKYLDRSQIIRGLVAALEACASQIDFRNLKNEEQLAERLIKGFRKS